MSDIPATLVALETIWLHKNLSANLMFLENAIVHLKSILQNTYILTPKEIFKISKNFHFERDAILYEYLQILFLEIYY